MITQVLLLAGLLDESPSAIVFGLVLAAMGAWSLIGAALDLEFFLGNYPASVWVGLLGRQVARVCYMVLGVVLIGLGIVIGLGLLPE